MKYNYYPRTVAQTLASSCGALKRCLETHNDWAEKHEATIKYLAKNFLPSGGGFNSGTSVDTARSNDELLVLETAFQHMDESGYTGWTAHTIKVRAGFSGLQIDIGGRDKNQIKDFMHDCFSHALNHELTRAQWFAAHGTTDPDAEGGDNE